MNLLLAGLAVVSTLQAAPVEMRGVWVVRSALASPESADAVVDGAARAGLNALFVQMRGRGDALYRSAIAPRSEVLRGQPADFDCSRAALTAFRGRRGRGWLLEGPQADPAGWAAHCGAAADALVARLAWTARVARPSIVVSAAVLPEAGAMRDKGQAWPWWIRQGLVAAACAMASTPDTALFRGQVQALRERLGRQATLWTGIGADRLPQARVVEKVRAARAAGVSGVVLFSSGSLATTDLDRMRDEAFGPAPRTRGSAPSAGSRRR